MKQKFLQSIDGYMTELRALSDDIFDHPEIGFEEEYACKVLTDYLKDKGFKVEIGTGTLPTAFRAEYEQGTGGPVVGFLGELPKQLILLRHYFRKVRSKKILIHYLWVLQKQKL